MNKILEWALTVIAVFYASILSIFIGTIILIFLAYGGFYIVANIKRWLKK